MPVNTYRVATIAAAQWAVEWLVDGTTQGFIFGRFDSRAEALYSAFSLTRMEFQEAKLESRRCSGAGHWAQIIGRLVPGGWRPHHHQVTRLP